MTRLEDEVRALRERVADLEETVKQMAQALRPPATWPSWFPRLTVREEAVFVLLMNREMVSRATFEVVVAPNSDNPEKLLDVYISKLRSKLTPHRIEITVDRGRGYRLSPVSRDLIRAAVAAESSASDGSGMTRLEALEHVAAEAKLLAEAVSHDDNGTMIGNQYVGGNGGLLSRETIKTNDRVRLALDALRQAAA